jgi:predicted dehydrogenase
VSRIRLAVVGAGRAGQARIRAIKEHRDGLLVAVVHRGVPPRFPEMLMETSIDAVIICTPNALHVPMAVAALEAGKHVLVEFPLAPGPDAARELIALAIQKKRVLHTEHIELLSPSQRAQRQRLRGLGRPTGGELRFEGGTDGWIGDRSLAGSPALGALARLHRLVDLFGDATVDAAALRELEGGGTELSVDLAFARGGSTRLVETRAPGRARATHWAIECERGVLDDPPPEPSQGLFLDDLDWFLRRIQGQGGSYLPDVRILHVLGLVASIEAQL